MSDPIALSDVPDDLGRNEPCPCGSGRKYKKCCQRAHRMQREAQKQSAGVDELIEPSTNPWGVYKVLGQVHANNMYALFYDMTHDEGPFRGRFASKTDFIQAADAGQESLVAGPKDDVRRIRLDGDDHYLLLTSGLDNPQATKFRYTVVVMRANETDAHGDARQVDNPGLRIWDVQRHERPKDSVDDGDLTLGDLGYQWAKDQSANDQSANDAD